ncbi:amidohydrolase [Embleya sp. NPDC001921]
MLERERREQGIVADEAADGLRGGGRTTKPLPSRTTPNPPPSFSTSIHVGPRSAASDLLPALTDYLAFADGYLTDFRRDLHAHAELGHKETRTTSAIRDWLGSVGLSPTVLPEGTGLICDIGSEDGPIIALRAGIDALPVADEKDVSYRSTNPGVCHDVGNDVQTTIVLGVGMFLAQHVYPGMLPGRIRLLFQPAAEQIPGGALDMIAAGGISDVRRIFALRCDPWTDAGKVALSTGAMTAACDKVVIHIARPGPEAMTATAKMMTEIPAALSTWGFPNPPRLGLAWERVSGDIDTGNLIQAEGRLWCLDAEAWQEAPDEVHRLLDISAEMYRARWEIEYSRGDRVVVNDSTSMKMLTAAATAVLGRDSVVAAPQRLVSDGFGWYLESIPGALARLGVRRPGASEHRYPRRGFSDVDEKCISAGIKLMVATVVNAFDTDLD